MLKESFINQTIQENLKINDKDEIENDYKKENTKDDSFNQLLSLQLLIQKHSGLKELCNSIYQFYFILFYYYSHKRKR